MELGLAIPFLINIEETNHFGFVAGLDIEDRPVTTFENLVQTPAGSAFLRVEATGLIAVAAFEILHDDFSREGAKRVLN